MSIPDPEQQFILDKQAAERAYWRALEAARFLPAAERQEALRKADEQLAADYRAAWDKGVQAHDPNEAGSGPGGEPR